MTLHGSQEANPMAESGTILPQIMKTGIIFTDNNTCTYKNKLNNVRIIIFLIFKIQLTGRERRKSRAQNGGGSQLITRPMIEMKSADLSLCSLSIPHTSLIFCQSSA